METLNGKEYHKSLLRLNLGRTALLYALEEPERWLLCAAGASYAYLGLIGVVVLLILCLVGMGEGGDCDCDCDCGDCCDCPADCGSSPGNPKGNSGNTP